jgi:hypothetical protein
MENLVDIQTELFLKKRYVRILNTHDTKEIIKKILEYSKKYESFLLLIYFEIIFDDAEFKEIENCISNIPNKIWIMSSTATKHPLYVEPIVNLLVWKEHLIDEIYDNNVYVEAFPKEIWESVKYKTNNKEYKSILSLRRRNIQRDMIYERINNNDVSILRYFHKDPYKMYPKWNNLIQEYLKTYVAYICETSYPTFTNTTCFTEKSILAFLCGNIPIILGKKNLIKELKEIGFWIANEYFGYDDYADSLEDFSEEKINLFVNCINQVNNIDIKQFYLENINHIHNNHRIVQDSFNKKYLL